MRNPYEERRIFYAHKALWHRKVARVFFAITMPLFAASMIIGPLIGVFIGFVLGEDVVSGFSSFVLIPLYIAFGTSFALMMVFGVAESVRASQMDELIRKEFGS